MVTSADIAKMLNLNQSTVSAVLAGNARKRRIAEETVERVLNAAKKAGYLPNASARNLRRGKSGAVGILLPAPASNVYSTVVGELGRHFSQEGYFTSFAFWSCDREQKSATNSILERQPEGIITVEPRNIPKNVNIPTITLINQNRRFDCITFDRVGMMHETISYLTELGHVRIANPSVSAYPENSEYDSVSDACRTEFASRGLSCAYLADLSENTSEYVSENNMEYAVKVADWLLSFPEAKRPTALILYTDTQALYVIQELHRRGLKVPEDISITGIDNAPFAAGMTPALTTFGDEPGNTLAQNLAKRLLFRMENPYAPVETVRVRRKLYIRESCSMVRPQR